MPETSSSSGQRREPRRTRGRRRLSWFDWWLRTVLGLGGIAAIVGYLSRLAGVRERRLPPSVEAPGAESLMFEETTPRKETVREPEGALLHPSNRYEPRDVQFGWILALIVLACGIASIHYYAVLKFYGSQARALQTQRKSPYPLVSQPGSQLPPQPRLEQIDRLANIQTSDVFLREAAKEKNLHRYGPTEEKGFVHIPIQRAMEAVAGKLPVSKEQPRLLESNGLLDSGESNSGRYYRGELR